MKRFLSKLQPTARKAATILTTTVLAAAAIITPLAATASPVLADSTQTYVTLGADLSTEERAAVLPLLGLTEEALVTAHTLTVTNAEEHQYLDPYLDASIIGSRALSSCKVTERSEGGITVETHNITYCTPAMYESALATAGLKNAEVVVAGPFNISGTAALVGAMKAYSEMTGNVISPELVDASTQELVVTSQIAENHADPDEIAAVIAAIKRVCLENDLKTDEEINQAIEEVSVEFQVTLSEEEKQMIRDLIHKLNDMHIDIKALAEQASGIYEHLSENGFDFSQFDFSGGSGGSGGVVAFFTSLLGKIADFFSGLFGR